MATVPTTPDSQYITLMSSASLSDFPDNTSSNFTVRFDPPMELRGGDFMVALTDIFYPTEWVNVTKDEYKLHIDQKAVTRNYTPRKMKNMAQHVSMRRVADQPYADKKDDDDDGFYDPLDDPSDPEHQRRAAIAREIREAYRQEFASFASSSGSDADDDDDDDDEDPSPTKLLRKRSAKPKKNRKDKKAKKDDDESRQQQQPQRGDMAGEDMVTATPPPDLLNTRSGYVHAQNLPVPEGHYKNIEQLLLTINLAVQKSFRENDKDILSMDHKKGRVRLRLKKHVTLRFSRKLADLLGFKKKTKPGPDKSLAEYHPHLKRHLGSLYVYLDLMQDRVVGDTRAPLIAMVPHATVSPDGLLIANHTVVRPYYFPVRGRFIETARCNIRDSEGDLVSFGDGDVTLTLHLVRVPS